MLYAVDTYVNKESNIQPRGEVACSDSLPFLQSRSGASNFISSGCGGGWKAKDVGAEELVPSACCWEPAVD